MPLDPNIPLSVQMPKPYDVMGQLGEMQDRAQRQQINQQVIRSNQALEDKRRQELAAERRKLQEQDTIDRLMQTALQPNADGVLTFNREALQQGTIQKNLGHLWPGIAKQLDEADTATANYQKKLRDADEDKRKALGAILLGVRAAGNDPNALMAGAASAIGNKLVKRDELQPLIDSLGPNPTPDAVKPLVDRLIAQAFPEKALEQGAKTREVTITKPDGSTEIRIVSDQPGQVFQSAIKPSFSPAAFRTGGRDVQGTFNQTTGQYAAGGQVVPNPQHIPPASIQINANKAAEAQPTIESNARQLLSGNLLTSMLSKRGTEYNETLALANALSLKETGKPLNLAKLQLDYEAAKRWVSSQNSSQMVRFQGLANSVVNTIDEVKALADELQQGGIQKWNQAKRSTIQQVYGNTPQSDLAARYVGAVNTLKEEFANLAQGGFAPTESAWKLADEQINKDFGFRDMTASLTEVQRLINYRIQGFNEVMPRQVPYGTSPASGGGAVAAPPSPGGGPVVTHRYNVKTGKMEPVPR